MVAPRTRYAKSGDVHVAYQVTGEDQGLDVVYVQGAFSHLDVEWELPAYRHFCEQLGSFARLIRFDKRGMGLSDRVQAGTLEERMDDVRAVMDAAGSTRAVLLGESEGGPLAMLFAAAHPERTAGLILVGAEVKEERTSDWPWGENSREEFEDAMAHVAERWGQSSTVLDFIAPSLADDDFARDWVARLQTNAMTPGSAETFMRMAFAIDVRSLAAAIGVPVLIVHRIEDRVCHVENARFLAREIRGARYVELPGRDHVPWVGDDVIPEIREFVTGVREAAEPDRVLATVLFTDIVDSTRRATDLGDDQWRRLLDRHDEVVREQLRLFRGKEIKTTGDGFLATFDGPARAIRCAVAIRVALEAIGVGIRAGIHSGEVELRGDDISGVAVVIAQRVCAHAGQGETLVSRTVVDLVAGSGLAFVERGDYELKGVPGRWQLYQVS